MEDLLSYVLPWAQQNREPVADITFRCFMYIEKNAGVLSRYNTLIAAEGATPQARQTVNQTIAKRNRRFIPSEETKIRKDKPTPSIEGL